jgi:pectin methylesterase-like acyl-CoA thioesterase
MRKEVNSAYNLLTIQYFVEVTLLSLIQIYFLRPLYRITHSKDADPAVGTNTDPDKDIMRFLKGNQNVIFVKHFHTKFITQKNIRVVIKNIFFVCYFSNNVACFS